MVKLKDITDIKTGQDGPKLAGLIEQLFDIQNDMTRIILDRITYRNILYYLGEQYIEFVKSAGSFRRRVLPNYIPTPVSNQIKDYVRSLKAMVLNQKLVPKVSPNTNEPEDAKAAEIASKLLEWMDGLFEDEFADQKEKMVVWLAMAGTTFMRTYPDMQAGKWFMTPKGEVNTGDVVSRSVVPFSVRLDALGEDLKTKRWVGLQTLQNREWVEDTFKIKVETSPAPDVIDYERKLMKLVSQVSPWKGAGLETQTYQEDQDFVLLREVEFRPTKERPNGRYVLTCHNKTLLDADRLPIEVKDDIWYYTLTDFHFDYTPGRFWADAPINDLISPQNGINEILQLLAENRKGIGRPRVISPGKITLKRMDEEKSGHSFLALEYDALLSGGKEPRIESGVPLPAQILDEFALHMATIQNTSGDPKNILKGQAPSSSSSGVQIDILRETAERGHYPDIDRFNRSMGRCYKKRLLVASEVYTDKRIIKIGGRGRKTEIFAFRASDLRGNTDVRLELDSGISTTKAGKTTLLMQLAEKGFLGPIDQNPELQEEFLSRMGLSGYTSQTNVDIQRAEEENAAVSLGRPQRLFIIDPEAMGEDGSPEVANMDPLFKYDDHNVHFIVHRRFILSGQFADLKTAVRTLLLAHADAHQTVLAQQAQAQMQAQAEVKPGGEALGSPRSPGGEPPPAGEKTPMGEPREPTESQFAEGGII
jgi:hypothetical protein